MRSVFASAVVERERAIVGVDECLLKHHEAMPNAASSHLVVLSTRNVEHSGGAAPHLARQHTVDVRMIEEQPCGMRVWNLEEIPLRCVARDHYAHVIGCAL